MRKSATSLLRLGPSELDCEIKAGYYNAAAAAAGYKVDSQRIVLLSNSCTNRTGVDELENNLVKLVSH